jgi:hypothetical protein
VPIVLKSGSLNLLETSGPVKACNGIALTFYSFADILLAFATLLLELYTFTVLGVLYEQKKQSLSVRFSVYYIISETKRLVGFHDIR